MPSASEGTSGACQQHAPPEERPREVSCEARVPMPSVSPKVPRPLRSLDWLGITWSHPGVGLQALGINLGFAGGMEALHFLFEGALDGRGGLSHAFLRQYENMMSVDTNPIYAILHESICAPSPFPPLRRSRGHACRHIRDRKKRGS